MSENKSPLVSVGMPVFNEVEFIEETLQRIRLQRYQNLEIIISDNASTDGTFEILQKAAKEDSRIKLISHPSNRGVVKNMNTVIKESTGDYFILASGHDLWHENLIEQLLNGILASQKTILAYPEFNRIDQNGKSISWENIPQHFDTTQINDPVRRFNTYLWCGQWPIYGLIAMQELRKTRGARNVVAPGVVLMCELAILGRFVHVPSVDIMARQNREAENSKQRRARYAVMATGRRQRFLPYWRLPISLLYACLIIPIRNKRPFETRVFLLISCLNSLARYRRYLVRDLLNLIPWKKRL